MRAHATFIYRTILVVTVLGVLGCAKEGARSGSTLVPNAQAARAVSDDPEASRRIELPFDPVNFVGGVQNPYFPLIPGTTYAFVQETPEGTETNTVEVTHDVKVILGVTTHVIHDRVYLEGVLKEDTFDWYAPDKDGNVWYFGEDTRELPSGDPTGSWEAGKDGARAGIIMLANPQVGDAYFQENAPGVVADQARVKSLNETVTVPYGTFTNCIKTAEWTPLEPGNRAFKYYASGYGVVLEVPNHGGGTLELNEVSP